MVRGWLQARNAPPPGAVEDRALTLENVPAAMIPYAPGSAPVFNADAALRIADCFAAVRCLADTAASLPLHAFIRGADGSRERFTGRLASLLERPSPATTTANLVGTIVSHLALHGNCWLGLYRDERGTVIQVAPLSPAAVTVSLEAGGEPIYTVVGSDGVSRHGREDVLHIRALSTDGLVGLSPIRQARQALGLADALATNADAFARNAARPGGILNVKTTLPGLDEAQVTEQYLAVQDRLQAGFTGANSGRVVVVADAELHYQQLALSMADAQWVEQRQLSTAEVARIFRIPAWMIGASDGSSMTYSNTQQQADAFLKFSLSPYLALIEQAISAHPDLSPASVFCEFVLDGLLRADPQTRTNAYQAGIAAGYLTVNDVRRMENLPPLPEPEAPTDV